MKYLKTFEAFDMDDLLDKINKSGMNSLTQLEKDFLTAYSKDDEEMLKIIQQKSEARQFKSSNGLFIFDYNGKNLKIEENRTLYYGTMYVPSIHLEESNETIEGKLEGSIEIMNGSPFPNFDLDYYGHSYTIYDFCEGLEYELDDFLQYIAGELEEDI